MSRTEILNTTGSNVLSSAISDEELEQYAIRQVQILDRVSSRFKIEGAPEHIHYEWHPLDPDTHVRLLGKGFQRDDELGKRSSYLNTDGTGSPMIGDVVCYSIDKRKYEVLQKIELKAAQKRNDPQRAIDQFEANINSAGIAGLEIGESHTASGKVTQAEIQNILKEVTTDV